MTICLINFFNSLFTPYGYKFEERGSGSWNEGWLIEKYQNTGMRWPTKEPWKSSLSGSIEVNVGIRNINSDGLLLDDTSFTSLNLSYITLENPTDVYPSGFSPRLAGYSVHEKIVTLLKILFILFTPYGYKFEGVGNDWWGNNVIREDYRNNGTKWPDQLPWHLVRGGRIELRPEYKELIDAGLTGLYAISVPSTGNTDNTIYELYFNYENLRPANKDPRFYGFSVRKNDKNLLYENFQFPFLRPMGISLKAEVLKASGIAERFMKIIRSLA